MKRVTYDLLSVISNTNTDSIGNDKIAIGMLY